VALAIGLALGAIVELVVVRRLFDAARVTLLVATIGVAQLLQALVVALPNVKGVSSAKYPVFLDGRWERAGVSFSGAQVAIVVVVPVCAGALGWFLNRTRLGGAVIASADNSRLARTQGINPKLVSTLVWAIAGVLSTISMVLIASQAGRASGIATLGPNTMVRALAAMVIAGMTSFRGSLLAGVAIGIAQALIRFNVEATGLIDLALFLSVLVAVWVRARHEDPDTASMSMRSALAPIPERLRRIWWIRWLPAAGFAVLLLGAAVLPLVVTTPSRILLYATVLAFAICAASVTVLTGWAGQLSLGQMAFAGLGALSAAAFARGPLPFALAIPAAAVGTALLAAVIGVGALRVNGLLLAVVTFAFGTAATQYLYRRPLLSDDQQSTVPFRRGTLFGLDLTPQRTYYYVLLMV
ncbi:MAG: ABC transporter, partial [Actinomycetota bacterium]|nr:ABC transporter [Actinomycetota bacterium]